MEKINAIIIDGKAYAAVPASVVQEKACICDLENFCNSRLGLPICKAFDSPHVFRYSPELTDKINKI